MVHPTKLVPISVSTVYMLLTIFFIAILIPSNNPKLFNESGDTSTSPFVIALDHAGFKGLPEFFNVVIMIDVIAIALESIYIASRTLGALSAQATFRSSSRLIFNCGKRFDGLSITRFSLRWFTNK